jgi:putative MATE family efflux protein
MNTTARANDNPLKTAPIGRLMLQFSIPSVIMLVVNSLYNIVDQIFIGQGVGYLGNAATNVIFPLTVLAMAVSLMLGDGGAAFMNLCLGEGSKKDASKTAGNVIIAALASSILLMCVCLILIKPLCNLLGATSDTLSYAVDYGFIIAAGFPFVFFSNSVSALIRADGSPRYSMAVMVCGAVTNTILDPLFIFGFGWGVKGAAWATIIGQAASAVLCLFYLRKFKHIDFIISAVKLELKTAGRICALGISSFITQASICLVLFLGNNLITHYGAQSIYGADIPLAAFGITMKVNQIMLGVCIGITVGSAPILSFNYGAKQIRRVQKTILCCIAASVAVMFLATIAYEFFPQYIVMIFGTGSELYRQFSIRVFRIHLCLSVLSTFQTVASIFFQAIGKPVKSMVISVSRWVVFLIPAMLVMSYFTGVDGVLWAGPIADGLSFALALPLVIVQFAKFKAPSLSNTSA